MGLDVIVLDEKEAKARDDYDLVLDFDNTICKENSGVRWAAAYIADMLGMDQDIAFKYREKGALNKIKFWIKDYNEALLNCEWKKSLKVGWNLIRALDYALSYKLKICPSEIAISKLTRLMKGCPVDLREDIASKLEINENIRVNGRVENIPNLIDGKKVRIKSRTDGNLIKCFLDKYEDFFSNVKGIELLSNWMEVENDKYTGRIKDFYVKGKIFVHPGKILYETTGPLHL